VCGHRPGSVAPNPAADQRPSAGRAGGPRASSDRTTRHIEHEVLLSPDEIESAIARFYVPERVSGELARPTSWGGYGVVERAGRVVGAGGGGITGPRVGELFVLYVDPP
jgi:hypothetical protein